MLQGPRGSSGSRAKLSRGPGDPVVQEPNDPGVPGAQWFKSQMIQGARGPVIQERNDPGYNSYNVNVVIVMKYNDNNKYVINKII